MVEFLLVLATENTGWKHTAKTVPGVQFTVTSDVAVSVPKTCATVPKFKSATFNAQVVATCSLTFIVLVEFAA